MTETQRKKRSEFVGNAMDYVYDLKGDDWQVGGGFAIGNSAFICGSNGEGNFANILIALFVKESLDLSKYKSSEEVFEHYIVSPDHSGKLTATRHIQISVCRFVHNIEYLCSYLNQDVSLKSLVELADMYNQPLQFTKEYLESLIISQPLSRLVLSTLLKQGKYDPLLSELFRFHINKINEHGYVGIYLDDKIKNIGYLSGRILSTIEYIVSLSENREPLRLSYSRFSASPIPMLLKLSAIVKRYIYTVPNLGRQMYLKNLLDTLLDAAKMYNSSKRYLSDNDQAMFAIGYKHQVEYFTDDSFTMRFSVLPSQGSGVETQPLAIRAI
ncbi:MAG: type I-C CRISPR-associated protein Cas8c/Csd1 [Rikenellaceae bacterium]